MLLDRKQTPWLIVTLLAAAAAIIAFAAESRYRVVSGSSPVGLTLGIIALVLMLFAAGLGLKRRVPHWRLGRAQTWMRGHVWMGLLVVLLVALHGNFQVGGPMTTWLWVLLAIVTVTGLLGVLLQQFVPSLLLHRVPGETVAQQLHRQLDALPHLAHDLIERHADNPPLHRFYDDHIQAFLEGGSAGRSGAGPSESLFQSLRTMVPQQQHHRVDELEQLCDRRHQLLQQRFWMRLLGAWLIIHVPLSWLLLLLAVAHGVSALRWGG